jgi:TetR/AcrR family tetracycline transcriptional repressor
MRKRRPDARPRPRLDLDLVVQAAIALLDENGLDDLTTRRLAARLGVQSAALYWHVRDKDELLDLVADAICAPALAPTMALVADASLGWRERWVGGLRHYRAALRSHRDAPRLLADRPPVGPVRRRLADAAVGAVLEAGFPDADAAMISLLIGDYVISIVSEEMRIEAWAAASAQDEAQESPAEGPEQYANLDRIAPHMAAVSSGALFEVGLEVLLDGIERRLERISPGSGPSGRPRRRAAPHRPR